MQVGSQLLEKKEFNIGAETEKILSQSRLSIDKGSEESIADFMRKTLESNSESNKGRKMRFNELKDKVFGPIWKRHNVPLQYQGQNGLGSD